MASYFRSLYSHSLLKDLIAPCRLNCATINRGTGTVVPDTCSSRPPPSRQRTSFVQESQGKPRYLQSLEFRRYRHTFHSSRFGHSPSMAVISSELAGPVPGHPVHKPTDINGGGLGKNSLLGTNAKNENLLVVSPYDEEPHLLDLRTLDAGSQILAKALVGLECLRADYATAPYVETFNVSASN